MSHVYGIIGSIGTFIALLIALFSYFQIKDDLTNDIATVLATFTGLSLAVVVTFFFFTRAYAGQLDRNAKKIREFDNVVMHLFRQSSISALVTQTYHNIMHHGRSLLCELSQCIEEFAASTKKVQAAPDDETKKKFQKIALSIERFMCLLTSNIKVVSDAILDDDTSVTIKKVNAQNNIIHTFWRDSVSERLRSVSDKTPDGSQHSYLISENTAFQLIVDPNHKQSTFFCNDLNNYPDYNNSNPKWTEYYNSAGVVPISLSKDKKRKIVGFLCVDGFSQNFENTVIKEVLCSYGDLLYVFFEKIHQLAEICVNGGVTNAVLEKFNAGNNSR